MTQQNPISQPGLPDAIFDVTCHKGHVSYFDKHIVCPSSSSVFREVLERGGAKLDVLYLKCDLCGEEMIVHVNCEGYK